VKAKPQPKRTIAEINAEFSSGQFEWGRRRRMVYGILLFCAAVIGYLTIWGSDTALQRDISQGAWLLAASTSGSWIFGAIWDDLNARKWGTPQSPAAEVPAPDRPELVTE
jgi:hypothetical protein